MIRRAEAADLAAVLDIWLEANQDAHAFVPAGYWQSCRRLVQEMLPQAEVYVHQDPEGRIDGFAGLEGDYLAGLFVRREARGRGVGKALLDSAKARRTALSLNVYQKNGRAAAFYKREGFAVREAGVDENTGEPDYTMTWKRPE